jgi:hypothetical protein
MLVYYVITHVVFILFILSTSTNVNLTILAFFKKTINGDPRNLEQHAELHQLHNGLWWNTKKPLTRVAIGARPF